MSNYTGPIVVTTFQDARGDKFALTFHVNDDDPESIEKIVARLAEDGYKPLPDVRKWYMINGSIEGERTPPVGPLGNRSRSAFLRS